MARTPTQTTAPAELIQVAPQAEQQLAALQDSALTQQQMDEVLAAGIDLGRLEAMDFVATIANSAILAIYENVKKSKAWRLLRNPESGDGRHFESLDEFCEVKLGKSYKRLRELTFNRNLIGQEAFEQAERLGLRQRDYNAIKALPAPDQELVRRAVEEAQSRDEVLDLLQELVVRHAKEKEQLQAEHQATSDLLDKRDEVERLQTELRQIKLAGKATQKLLDEAGEHLNTAKGAIGGVVRASVQALMAHSLEGSGAEGQDRTCAACAMNLPCLTRPLPTPPPSGSNGLTSRAPRPLSLSIRPTKAQPPHESRPD
ncbi:MAG TPA: hypothetical protein PLM12_11390 [Comamonas denitrificans]|nr:hypothetical protein [Comamonas denitrificans]